MGRATFDTMSEFCTERHFAAAQRFGRFRMRSGPAVMPMLIGRKFIPLFAASFVHSIRCVGTAMTTAEPIQSVGVCWYNACKNGEHASRSYLARRMLL